MTKAKRIFGVIFASILLLMSVVVISLYDNVRENTPRDDNLTGILEDDLQLFTIAMAKTLDSNYEAVSFDDSVDEQTRQIFLDVFDDYLKGITSLFNNDGDFIYRLTHPKHEINKTYQVTLKGKIAENEVEKLKNGVQIEDYITGKAKVKILRIDKEKSLSRVEIIIHEGKNREVRKMCEAIGRKVLALHRTKIGNISVKDLRLGTWRYLKPNEIKSLLDI